ncbi:hypothetical protein, partial [Escherichia coli]|uniref:hypothetical protein n=1 Tax=Escherichia coli TaxID=562 RepID=UPI0032E3D7C9
GFEETRVRSIASIDPERTGSAPTFPARTKPQDTDWGRTAPGTNSGPGAPPSHFTPPAAFDGGPQATHDAGPQDWGQATVLRGSAGSGATSAGTPVYAADSSYTGPVDATVHRPVQADEPLPVQPTDHSKRNLWLGISGGTLLALAAVVGIVVANAAPNEPKTVETQQASAKPVDAMGDGGVPEVANLRPEVQNEGSGPPLILFRWDNPGLQDGDSYRWRIKS